MKTKRYIKTEKKIDFVDTHKYQQNQYNNSVVFDMTETEFVHAAFIGFLMDAHKKYFVQIMPSDAVLNILSLLGLMDYFNLI